MEILRKHLSCSICSRPFKTPRMLECLHSFCETCLQEQINQTASEKHFNCPKCGVKISPENGDEDKAEWSKQFPHNEFIVSMLDWEKQSTAVSMIKDQRCQPCTMDGQKSDVFGFCTVCVEYLCQSCFNEHRKIKITRNHRVLQGPDLPTDIKPFQRLVASRLCKKHLDKEIEFKCVHHNVFICSLCAVTVHRQCEPLVALKQIDESPRKYSEEILEKINKIKKSVDLKISDYFKQAQKLTIELSKMKRMKLNLISVIRYITDEFGVSYAGCIKEQQSGLSNNIAESAVLLKSINDLNEFTSVVMNHGERCQIELLRDEIIFEYGNIYKNLSLFGDSEKMKESTCLIDDIIALKKLLSDSLESIFYSAVLDSDSADDCKPATESDIHYKGNKAKKKTADSQSEIHTEVATQTHSKTELVKSGILGYIHTSTQTETPSLPELVKSGILGYIHTGTQTETPSLPELVKSGILGYIHTGTQTEKPSLPESIAQSCFTDREIQTVTRSKDNETQTVELENGDSDNSRGTTCSRGRIFRPEIGYTRKKEFSLPPTRTPKKLLDRELRRKGQHDLSLAIECTKTCSHKASVLRNDGWMIFMDAKNNVIKLVTPEFAIKSHIKFAMEIQPLDMCLTGNENVVIATSKGICIFPTGKEKLGKPAFFPMKYDPVSVCSMGKHIAILCAYRQQTKTLSCVQIRKLNNEIVKQIDTFTNKQGKTFVLYDPRMIRTWGKNEFLISEPRYVKRFDTDGNLLWYFTEYDLQNVSSISLDSEKNVYICDSNKGYVYQISSFTYFTMRIIAYGVGIPRSVLFTPENKTITVGCLDDNICLRIQ